MKIGIIGCGYVGRRIALRWKQAGHHVRVTTRSTEKMEELQPFCHQVYLLESNASLATFISQQELLLISVAPTHFANYVSTYLHTAQQVAAQVNFSPLLRHILYTSSTSVYGDHGGAWVSETAPIMCSNENTKILYKTEQILLGCASKELNVCIFRLGEIYGPGREIENRIQRTFSEPFAGTGAAYTNLIHVEDITNALDFAFRNQLQGIFNLCNDFHIPRKQFYEDICRQEKLPAIQWDPTRASPHGGNRRVSNQKIKETGFSFVYPAYA